jgi:TFIIF-interacting CTD phosphatase-like protein
MTKKIYEQLGWVKRQRETNYIGLPESKKFAFKFKKKEFSKLLIFDLDETLIHAKRDFEECIFVDRNVFEPDINLKIEENGEKFIVSFSIRPHFKECL